MTKLPGKEVQNKENALGSEHLGSYRTELPEPRQPSHLFWQYRWRPGSA